MSPSIRVSHFLGFTVGVVFCSALLSHFTVRHGLTLLLHAAGLRQNNCASAPSGAPAPTDRRQILEGTDKDDILTGNETDDWIFGFKGNDVLSGAGGRDRIDGGLGDDLIDGGPGDDLIFGCEGSDTIRGGDGNDTIDAGDDDDFVDGGAGNDRIDGGDGNDILRGGPGDDLISGGDDNDFLEGGTGNDRLSGDDANDVLRGGAGNDNLLGGEGDDDLDGESGDDRLDGGRGNDLLRGGQGADTLLGNAGNDTIDGGPGHDVIYGGDDNDVISGGLGDDLIIGGTGADVAYGNDGNDLFVLRAGDVPNGEVETINGGNGTDVLILVGFGKVPGIPPAGSGAEWQLIDPATEGIYRIVNVERVEFSQVLAQAQDSRNHMLSISLVNPAASATTGRMLLFGTDGSIVAPMSSSGQPSRDELTFTIPAFGSVRLSAQVPDSVVAQVFASVPVGALIRSDATPAGASLGESPLIDSAVVRVLENRAAGATSGVLVVNGLAQSRVKFTLHTMDGDEPDGDTFIGAKEVDLPAYGHRVLFVRDLFPRLGDFEGTMTVAGGIDRAQEGGPIAVVALERATTGRVSASPAVSISPSIRREMVHIAGLTVGGDTTSAIVLVNPSTTPAQGTLRFFDEAGNPWTISVNRQAPAPTVNYDLSGRASAVFTMPAGAVQHGSVRAETAKGTLSAMLRIGSSSNVVTIPSSRVFSSFIAPVLRQRSNGTTTRVSLNSTGTATVLQLKLHSATGADIAGGTAEIRLPANGQTTRTVEELFPSAAETLDGTLTVTAAGGTVAVSVVLIEGTSSTSLPVIALQ